MLQKLERELEQKSLQEAEDQAIAEAIADAARSKEAMLAAAPQQQQQSAAAAEPAAAAQPVVKDNQSGTHALDLGGSTPAITSGEKCSAPSKPFLQLSETLRQNRQAQVRMRLLRPFLGPLILAHSLHRNEAVHKHIMSDQQKTYGHSM